MDIPELPTEQILPRVLLVRQYDTAANHHRTQKRISEHYEISLYLEGTGRLSIRGAEHPLGRGAVRFTPPGVILSSTPDYRCITVYFDLSPQGLPCRNPILEGIPEFFETDCSQLPLFRQLLEAYGSESLTAPLRMNQLILSILATFYEETRSREGYSDAVNRCIRYLRGHFSENITLETLGALTGYSGLHLMRLFNRETGRSPHKWLTAIRLLEARKLLEETDLKLEEVASRCGFGSVSHFKQLFRQASGCTPGQYRKNARQG